ncbi:MAG TPA: MBL fold metallo-hydrolase [Bacteroidales bacterium]|nr:MBL fold metallo-hydrolase [Bacteroidales bacterium]
MAIQLHTFVFNGFGVNNYILEAENGDCIIVDAACSNDSEKEQLKRFFSDGKRKPVMLINTHTHIDHVLGCAFVQKEFGIQWLMHSEAQSTLREAPVFASLFGINNLEISKPDQLLEDGQELTFDNTTIKILYTPGHAPGSICLYIPAGRMVITGDVLFNGSIGRTDLTGGNFDVLMESIHTKLLTLPDDTIVYPGHGPATTIGDERTGNPYLG